MNRLAGRPWFGPGLGVILYLVGFNGALLHGIGIGWLRLGRIAQTVIVLVAVGLIVGLMAYLTSDYLNERRSAYRTAVRAAGVNDANAGTFERTV